MILWQNEILKIGDRSLNAFTFNSFLQSVQFFVINNTVCVGECPVFPAPTISPLIINIFKCYARNTAVIKYAIDSRKLLIRIEFQVIG